MNILELTCSDNAILPILQVVKIIIDAIRIAVPVILIVMGMLDLAKAVMSSKEDEIKKGQKVFVSRLIAAVFVFLIATLVQFIISILPEELVGTNWEQCINVIFGK